MIYPQNFEQKIGFDEIRRLLKGHCLSTLGQEKVGQMQFMTDLHLLRERPEQTREFLQLLEGEEEFPVQDFYDVRPAIRRIRVEGTYLDENELHFVIEIRSARDSLRTYLFQRMQRLARLLGGTCVWSNDYPSWNLQAVSPLRDICARVYEQTFGGQPVMLTVHGGLEVGYFTARCPGMDAVSIGPDCRNFHSPSEMVSIPSVRRVYGYLCSVLKEIR